MAESVLFLFSFSSWRVVFLFSFTFFPMRLNRFAFPSPPYTPGFTAWQTPSSASPSALATCTKRNLKLFAGFGCPWNLKVFLEYCEKHVGANTWIRRVERLVIKSNTTPDKLQEMGTFPGVLMCSRRHVSALDVGGALVTLHCWLLFGNKIWRYCQTIGLIVFWAAQTARFPLCPHVVSAAADTGDKKWSEIVALSLSWFAVVSVAVMYQPASRAEGNKLSSVFFFFPY